MVVHSTRVYARLKKEARSHHLEAYEIVKKKSNFDDLIFLRNGGTAVSDPNGFRFHKVFDQGSCQSEIFDTVAKPVINSILEGFNGTIFAYGQTGSGKTYTITGSPKNYNDRGIIPRSIQYIFEQNDMISEKPTIYISYMEIYNEVGYDLLSPKQRNTATSLEELPRITLMEDKKGEAHIRNLSVLPVTTEQEAMRLLFLGDTNRTIAETPMNEYSSRSHCIFTIYITNRNSSTNRLRYSKLHLVDLAGSERVSKSLTTGIALHEAKHINLSLHFLQQVILALSESKRSHIPYRNSMMTFILKDSLSGNCFTTMLATVAVSKNNIQETLSTCKFAQRVSLITTEPIINEMSDPQHEISFLKNKINELQLQIASLTCAKGTHEITKEHKQRCQFEVEKYLQDPVGNKELTLVQHDLTQVQFCFGLLKKEILSQKKKYDELKMKLEESSTEVQSLKEHNRKKTEEINALKNIIDKIPEKPVNLSMNQNGKLEPNKDTKNCFSDHSRTFSGGAFASEPEETEHSLKELFLTENPNNLNFYKRNLESKLETARMYAQTIDQCQENISYIRKQLENSPRGSRKALLINELEQHQNIYRKALIELKDVQKETTHLETGLEQEEIRANYNFKRWLEEIRSKTVQNNCKTYAVGNCFCASVSSKQGTSLPSCAPSEKCSCISDDTNVVRYTSTNCRACPNQKNFFNESRIPAYASNCTCEVSGRRLHNVMPDRASQNTANCTCLPSDNGYASRNSKDARYTEGVCSRYTPMYCDYSRDTTADFEHPKYTSDNYQYDQNLVYRSLPHSLHNYDTDYTLENKPIHCKIMENNSSQFEQELNPSGKFVDETSQNKAEQVEPNDFVTEAEEQIGDGEVDGGITTSSDYFEESDSSDFVEFMKTVPLTGDDDVDREIFSFYRSKF
ncbi:hypothetical protein JTB14_017723 [Gonioctena quinquepunctata]|nr:hypothetical protein JTB14_017723 [Gonioctena quinquepunctata]